MKKIMMVVMLVIMLAPYVGADEWRQITTTGEIPARIGHKMANVGGMAYTFGGNAAMLVRCPIANDIWKYSPDENMWEEEFPNDPPDKRMGYSVVTYDDKMYMLHGHGSGQNFDDIWSYEPTTQTWKQEESNGASTPAARVFHSTVIIGDKIWLFGGLGNSGDTKGDLWRYDIATGNWEQKESIPQGYERYAHIAWPYNNTIYVHGGEKNWTPVDDLWNYDIETNTWNQVSPGGDLPSARAYHTNAYDGDKMWMFGGEDFTTGFVFAETWEFDNSTNTWTRKTDGPIFYKGASAFFGDVTNPKIILFGGEREGGYLDETWEYTPDGLNPAPDIKANGSDDPLLVTPSESVDISISLDPGDMAGVWADWWGILLSSYGNFPLFGFQCPIFELPDTSLFSIPWPMGWYIFLFGLDDVPDGAFELDWYDYVIVVSQPAGAQLKNIPDFDAIVKEKMRELTGE